MLYPELNHVALELGLKWYQFLALLPNFGHIYLSGDLEYSIRTVLVYEAAKRLIRVIIPRYGNIYVSSQIFDGFIHTTIANWFLRTHVFLKITYQQRIEIIIPFINAFQNLISETIDSGDFLAVKILVTASHSGVGAHMLGSDGGGYRILL